MHSLWSPQTRSSVVLPLPPSPDDSTPQSPQEGAAYVTRPSSEGSRGGGGEDLPEGRVKNERSPRKQRREKDTETPEKADGYPGDWNDRPADEPGTPLTPQKAFWNENQDSGHGEAENKQPTSEVEANSSSAIACNKKKSLVRMNHLFF